MHFTRRAGCALLLAALLTPSAGLAHADGSQANQQTAITDLASISPSVLVDATTRTFPVTGSTLGALTDQIRARVPDNTGESFAASTTWRFTWSYPYVFSDQGCAAGTPEVDVHVQFLLPDWQPPAATNPALVNRWSTFMGALQTHEDGHEQIAVDAGHQLADALTQLSPSATCDQFDAAADQTIQAVLAQNDRDQSAYDQATDHGATQGAVFP